MLGGALPSLLDANSFGEIAEAAIVLELVPLKAACVSFAKGSEAVQQKLRGKKLPVAVRELLTPGRSSAPTAPQGKRRKVL